jgi:hypothetical protein
MDSCIGITSATRRFLYAGITSKGGSARPDARTGKTYYAHTLWTPYVQKRKTKSGMEGVYQVPPRRRKMLDEEREMIDLEVEGGVFLIGDGLVTHNSVRDRATTAHEFWFQLAKGKRYYWDAEAVMVAYPASSIERFKYTFAHSVKAGAEGNILGRDTSPHSGIFAQQGKDTSAGRNRRTSDFWNESLDARIAFYRDQLAHLEHVKEHGGILLDEGGDPLGLHINTQGYKGAHFATFGEKLIMPLILGGTSARGACPSCGSPWVRVTEKESAPAEMFTNRSGPTDELVYSGSRVGGVWKGQGQKLQEWRNAHPVTTTGWTPTCSHYDALYYSDFPKPKSARKWAQRAASGNWFKRVRKRPGLDHWPVEPCTVLDIFLGSGTTAATARRLGRKWVGIELNKKYCDDHIIPRLSEPLFEWAEREPEPEIEQAELFSL